ncbi:hypothetical protein [Cellulomonas sp. PhB143]|uniref:hypothetical protein n=1 Tax=Cellulomonas sp. PhB143 TaxID=2485186 RepID=UPI000F45FD08|nr:hypothetical protein [Cellulomonas sp. PhB143]ROS79083.1 hypothetical protein EDF32_0129 [Cellulomonas sp. PhB143]
MGSRKVVWTPEEAELRARVRGAAVDLAAYLHGYGARVAVRRVVPARATLSVRPPGPEAQPVTVQVWVDGGAASYTWADPATGTGHDTTDPAEVRDRLGVRVRRPWRDAGTVALLVLGAAALAGAVALVAPGLRHEEYLHPLRTAAVALVLAGAGCLAVALLRVRRRVRDQREFAVRIGGARAREQALAA